MRQWISIPIGNGVHTGFSWRVRRGSAHGCAMLFLLLVAVLLVIAHPWLLTVAAGIYGLSVYWRYVR
jgi:hypothetical protein